MRSWLGDRKQLCCPWSLVVFKDRISVLGPCLGLEPQVLGPVLGLNGLVLGSDQSPKTCQGLHLQASPSSRAPAWPWS